MPVITALLADYVSYRLPFVVFAVLILLFVGFTMFCHPGQPTISMIAEKDSDLIGNEAGGSAVALTNRGITDDTTPLRAGVSDTVFDDDDASSVTSDASSVFRMHGDRDTIVDTS